MNPELQAYIFRFCTQFMTKTESRVLKRLLLTPHGYQTTLDASTASPLLEELYGFKDETTNNILASGDAESIRLQIAQRLWAEADRSVFNFCPECEALARTPQAKQCRHCGHDWH